MSVYNSSRGANQDEDDLTMIDQSFLYGHTDEPTSNSVVKHLRQAQQSTKNTTDCDDKHDYIYVEHDRFEAAKQIEQILIFYRQNLKQESNTQLDCSQQLITRLIDFIRPTFSTSETKMNDLDRLYEEISDLQDIRFIEQKEKTEQLTNELIHLKKIIITSPNESNRNDDQITKAYQINSMANYQQWIEMEEESKKLHHLVETQRNKINELVKLLFQQDEPSVPEQKPTAITTEQHQPSGTVNNNSERPIVSARIPSALSRLPSSSDIENCPICKYKFPRGTNEIEIDVHVEQCLTASNNNKTSPESDLYKCPNCERKIQGGDQNYMQHLAECYNERTNTF